MIAQNNLFKDLKNQKNTILGKKHTIKNELITTKNKKGRIVNIGKIKPGSMHDFKVRKEGGEFLKKSL